MPDRPPSYRSLFFAVLAAFAVGALVAACGCVWAAHRAALFGIDFDNLPLLHLIAAGEARALPLGAVVVDRVPPDACLAVYGPGPCREHGSTIVGSTDAIAGPPPASWRGAVR